MKKVMYAVAALLLATQIFAADRFTRTEDIIYGRKFGTALTLDILRPPQTNGFGILWMVSGGWFSDHEAINPVFVQPLLDRGYTVFAVVHGSQPKFTIPEIEKDIHRAVRFVRYNASKFGVDPNHLGITGGSAGGHLSLTMAVKGTKGDPGAKDAVDQESSEVQCVACFFPPTDFLNYGKPGEDAVGIGVLKSFKPAFGAHVDSDEEREKLGRQISPIYFVHEHLPPILIIHGDADKLVPIQQAESFVKRCEETGNKAKLVVREGKQHGWSGIEKDVVVFADWFDEYLRGIKPKQ